MITAAVIADAWKVKQFGRLGSDELGELVAVVGEFIFTNHDRLCKADRLGAR